jgi:hypothetical protein
VEIGTETAQFPEKEYKNVISLQCRKPDLMVLSPSVSAPRYEEWSGKNKNEKLDDVKKTENEERSVKNKNEEFYEVKRQKIYIGVERTRTRN